MSQGHDVQDALVEQLVGILADEEPSVERTLFVVFDALRELAGLDRAAICILDRPEDPLTPLARVGGLPTAAELAVATEVYWGRISDGTALPLRRAGETTGVLLLAGRRLDRLRTPTMALVTVHLAGTLRAIAADRDRRFAAHAGRAVRRLFEEGMPAASVEAAGEVVARVTAEAFRTERAGLQLIDPEGRIRHTVGVGITAELSEALAGSLIGKLAADSPVWRTTELSSGPILVDHVEDVAVRGDFVETLGLRSYVAIPLLCAAGLVGMVMCGDVSRSRSWSARDKELARQLVLEGGLIIDSARLRQAERVHVAELTHRAFHDPLTGLPNRAQLFERIERGARALLLIDLDGFKQVNDTMGHHAGDALLVGVAERLLGTVAAEDLVARLGGDEFAVLVHHDETAWQKARRIDEAMRQPFTVDGRTVGISASIGVARGRPDLLRSADAAMYASKRSGTGPHEDLT